MLNSRYFREPQPMIWKDKSLQEGTISVASTTFTRISPYTASFSDLSELVPPGPLLLPPGSCVTLEASQETDGGNDGSRIGKYVARSLSRELSLDADDQISPETLDLLSRLMVEGALVSTGTGCHVKVVKLTTYKSSRYKTILRHSKE